MVHGNVGWQKCERFVDVPYVCDCLNVSQASLVNPCKEVVSRKTEELLGKEPKICECLVVDSDSCETGQSGLRTKR